MYNPTLMDYWVLPSGISNKPLKNKLEIPVGIAINKGTLCWN